MQDVSRYPRRILLAVTGLSPQIVTETLYALAVASPTPFIPTEIHLITTAEGAERVRLALLSDQPGWFHRLRADYRLPPIAFDSHHIHVLRDAAGNPLPDIRSPADNLLCADYIAATVRQLTADPDAALHVSIAGGRKTMGFFLGYALSLFGRAQDRLSHVLVSDPFEASWDFFYPTPYENVIETAGRKLVDTRDAQITLADIPFVSLRHGLPAALLAVFARRALEGAPALPPPQKEVPDPAWAERYLRELRAITGPLADLSATERALRKGMDGAYFSSRLSKLRSALRKHLGVAAGVYRIDDGGGKAHRYRLALGIDAVRVQHSTNDASLRRHR